MPENKCGKTNNIRKLIIDVNANATSSHLQTNLKILTAPCLSRQLGFAYFFTGKMGFGALGLGITNNKWDWDFGFGKKIG